MDRKGRGPVRWDEFYGKTAKEYGNNGWGDHRPQQFAFVYRADNNQIARAREQIANLAKDQAALLERRQKHEADQSRLWATLAWEFRGQLQASLRTFATGTVRLDEQVASAAKSWGVNEDKSTATPDSVPAMASTRDKAPAVAAQHSRKSDALVGTWDCVNSSTGTTATEAFYADATCDSFGSNGTKIPGHWHEAGDTIEVIWDSGVRQVFSFQGTGKMSGTGYNSGKEYMLRSTKRN